MTEPFFLNVVSKDWAARHMVYRDIKETLDLGSMQVNGDERG